MITWSWLAERASPVSWFPAEMSLEKFRVNCKASEFWMQWFYQLWKKIGIQKWMWNCGIERGLFNPNSISTTREKTSSGRLALHEEWKFMAADFERWILRFTSHPLTFKTEATLSLGNSRRFVGTYSFGCKENESFKVTEQVRGCVAQKWSHGRAIFTRYLNLYIILKFIEPRMTGTYF